MIQNELELMTVVHRLLGLMGYTDTSRDEVEDLKRVYNDILSLRERAAIGDKFKEAIDAANNT